MNISSLTPMWFYFLVKTYNLKDLESNPTTATHPSCGVGKPWYLSASVFHLTNVANAAFCTKYIPTAAPHMRSSALQPHPYSSRSLGGLWELGEGWRWLCAILGRALGCPACVTHALYLLEAFLLCVSHSCLRCKEPSIWAEGISWVLAGRVAAVWA